MEKLSGLAAPSASTTSPAEVIMADFTAIGDQSGYLALIRAAIPARLGAAMDVPDMSP
ncbi:hypothetical protein ACFFX0_14845 [Citricoccus parietis]|uniref:Uncharacterized protein n=1 Tax=Citricoccus parietis TaxID=592307 RepID=A0ABV5G0F7_9MICC